MKGTVTTVRVGRRMRDPLGALLDRAGLAESVLGHGAETILIKPNLVDVLPPPITTPPALVGLLIDYLRRRCPEREIIIGEGTASAEHDTDYVFRELGYGDLAAEKGVELVDLNREPVQRLKIEKCRRWPEMVLPAIALDAFLLSVPVLKAHTLAGVTLTLKNMMGLAPPSHYQQGGCWKKSSFHDAIQEAIADLNRYRHPDFTLLDGTRAMAQSHLGGPELDPAPGLLAAGDDPVAMDSFGAGLLGIDWQAVGHIRMLDNELGQGDGVRVIPVP